MHLPKISIVTPNFNMDVYLEATIDSILSQGYPNLEYIIIDGGSSDRSVEIIKKYSGHLTYWVSERDGGLYDGLNKGLSRTTGEIMGWLNSDDILHKGSLMVLSALFSRHQHVAWIQGAPTTIDTTGSIIHRRPHVASRLSFLLKEYEHDIDAYIQQESTYWRRSLWQKAGSYIDSRYKLAGDFDLWMRFFRHAELYNSNALVGAFRKRGGQKSADIQAYINEANAIIEREQRLLDPSQVVRLKALAFLKKIKNVSTPLYNKFVYRFFEIKMLPDV